jgi:hypothetical protein
VEAIAIHRTGLILLSALGAAACISLSDADSAPTVWEAELTPERSYPDLSGQAAAVSDPNGTSTGISIEGAEPGAVHQWGLRVGSCTTPGGQVGPDSDYPELVVGEVGDASVDTHLAPRLASDGEYHVEVRVSASDPTRVACGDLARR